ncbi:hypothetical protein B0T21DRAFT_346784 [Apiosordaria backusii]|uniref:Uncharacterized protein n=1 Tax=Apiosordaria backusii TaxID=314023 RepID=A0AA40EHS3_9PEZI|nr:hypothetical protein B0T21DRAFT_346784 [Apiosordaria backusii]
MPKHSYTIDCYEQPGLNIPPSEQHALQQELIAFASAHLNPLRIYNIFDTSDPTALNDKIIVTIRLGPPSPSPPSQKGDLVALLTASLLPISFLPTPLLDAGLTLIHPLHRKSPQSIKRLLFGTLFLCVFPRYPSGVWLASIAEVITSLVQISRYTLHCYPSPSWPSGTLPEAEFDEEKFVFRGSNDTPEGRVFMKDVDDSRQAVLASRCEGITVL